MQITYDRNYFLTECEGFRTFLSSKGLKLSPRLRRIHERIFELRPQRALDFGCGRGELALNLALGGAETWGVDVSPAAIELSNEIRKYWLNNSPQMKLEFLKIEGVKLPFKDDFFDAVVFSDIVEHLEDWEIAAWFSEALRTLKPGGTVYIHTSPNWVFLNFGLKLYWLLGRLKGRKLDWNMKAALPEGLGGGFHVNEQTSFSLKSALTEAGFSSIETEFWKNPHYVYYFLQDDSFIRTLNKIYRFLPLKHLFFADLFTTAKK